ncbi:MAG: hypothetical protein Q8835_02595 [Sweet potato little leaf phytoplasma]|nr:hypothetical protein [Sweet potato little leaf phytoplasma]
MQHSEESQAEVVDEQQADVPLDPLFEYDIRGPSLAVESFFSEEKEDEEKIKEKKVETSSDSETDTDFKVKELDDDQILISSSLRKKRRREIRAERRTKNKNDPIFAKRSRTGSMDASSVRPTTTPTK